MSVPKKRHLQNATTLLTRQMNKYSVSFLLFELRAHYLSSINMAIYPVELQMKNWTSGCYKHFKPPIIIEDKGEIKYQFVCQTCVPIFLPYTKPHIFNLATPPSSSRGNARRIPRLTSSATSSRVKVKWSKTPKALRNMHMGLPTTRPNFDT